MGVKENKDMRLDKKLIEELEQITLTDYEFNSEGETKNWDIIVEDLIREYEDLLDEYNDYKEREVTRYDVEY